MVMVLAIVAGIPVVMGGGSVVAVDTGLYRASLLDRAGLCGESSA